MAEIAPLVIIVCGFLLGFMSVWWLLARMINNPREVFVVILAIMIVAWMAAGG